MNLKFPEVLLSAVTVRSRLCHDTGVWEARLSLNVYEIQTNFFFANFNLINGTSTSNETYLISERQCPDTS